MRNNFFQALLLLCVGVFGVACKPEPPKAPRGYFEYRGDTPQGHEAVIRMTVAGGPFIRFLGFAPPSNKSMSKEEYDAMIKKFDRYWLTLPEMLTRFENGEFIGIGAKMQDKVLFRYDPKTDEITSNQPGTEGLRLKRITSFEPIDFPKYRQRCLKENQPGWK